METDRAGPGRLAHQGDVVRVPTWTSEVTSVIQRGRCEFAYDVYVLFKKFVKKLAIQMSTTRGRGQQFFKQC